ncbi:hypothetical protein BAUCODRAFT_386509 [Baudoinia panamericana UAMH 10762]|uniref:DUF676 domain-containing protein n=1 Tax=Baudoinia panamericana (strain UAMH 10762) TaxID=717646 RepID=M2N4S1_BAUPA|nr:uncharacterized protein BAUCODRAFT_386509 [Baudoinia panamericana UAMH 10762]EMC98978.1 hypothetical protein BAUCODRAFT_386509 [Baudoinia panamericana UAMH 10762]
MAAEIPQDAGKAEHLVVMIHGLWGNPVHLSHLRDTLVTQHAEEGLYILIPKSNRDNFTYDGIEVGAERITHEIEEKIKSITEAGGKLSKISVAGYSLGGLIARYVVGLLYTNGVFDELRPMNFTTFATPHLGVRTPRLGYRAQTWNFLGSRTLSTSGQQMFLVDNFRNTGKPLLSVLAEPNSIFVRGLNMFQRKSIYANTINDRSVPFYTSGISRVDPYVDLDAVELHPLPDQDQPVVLDPDNPVTPRKTPTTKALTLRERYDKAREALPFYAFLFTFIPIAIPLFMVNAGYQTYQSSRRVALHEKGGLIDLKRYRIPLLEEAQAVQDKVIERLAGEETHMNEVNQTGYLPTPPPEPAVSHSTSTSKLAQTQQESGVSPWPSLALTDEQFAMIDNLDAHVGLVKYPVHIQKVRHTHAAIVMRIQKEQFDEGRAVSAHWAKHFVT